MRITIKNKTLIAEINTLGGAIESLQDVKTGEEHIWPYDAERWSRRTSICFPICSALKGGVFTHDGQRYEMPMHGFLRECEMDIVSQEESRAVLAFSSNEGTRKNYPFDFLFELIQYLDRHSLVVEYRITNTGAKDLLFSVGSHYTYLLPVEQQACSLQFAKPQHAGLMQIEGGEITGKGEDFFCGSSELSVKDQFKEGSRILERGDLDTDFIALAVNGKPYTTLESEGFPYLVLWAQKDDCPFVCIEFWAGMADFAGHDGELKHKHGIQTAGVGETRMFRQIITV